MTKIHVIFLIFEEKYLEDGINIIEDFLSRHYKHYVTDIIIVDNSRCNQMIIKYNNYKIISGDNACLDFSGWEKGYKYLDEKGLISRDDVLIFCNDSFYRNYDANLLDGFKTKDITPPVINDKLVGFVDSYKENVQILGKNFKNWVRSNFFIISVQSFLKLNGIVFPMSEKSIFNDSISEFFNKAFNISDNYKAYLRQWLFGEISEYKEYQYVWNMAKSLTPNTFYFFKKKTMAILSEQYMSLKARMEKVEIIDIKQNLDSKKYNFLSKKC